MTAIFAFRSRSLAAAAACFLFVPGLVCAQFLADSKLDIKASAEVTGTIKEYSAGNTLILETLPPNEPIQFKLAGNVKYADTDGKPLDAAGLTTNRKVRVHYNKLGGDNVADKVTLIGN